VPFFTDGGHRAAFIARWPGMIDAGSVSAHQVRKRLFGRHFVLTIDRFTKTGSGQTWEKLRNEWRSLAVVLLRFPSDSGGADRWGTHALFSLPTFLPITAKRIIVDHFSAFESELVAL